MYKQLLPLLLASFLIVLSTNSYAEDEMHNDYWHKVGHKALTGFANMSTAVLEIPKNVINTTNSSHIVFGITGGMAKGIMHTVARAVTGLADFITFPLPTKPIAYPNFVWDDFDVDSTYGETFRLDYDK